MLGMGLTLTFDDFRQVLRLPRQLALGVAAQFLVMPFLGWGVGRLFQLPTDLAVGLILVSCCPGGTASNVVTYLARANLPLSVLMTTASTLAAVALTPLLTSALAGTLVEVQALAMLGSMVQIVLLPVLAGVAINQFLLQPGPLATTIRTLSPLFSVFFIAAIVGFILATQRDAILAAAWTLFLSVAVFHLCGFGLGYALGRWLKLPEANARTLSIEVGMQNSGLGTALAKAHFAAHPLVAVPCALSAIYHCLLGSLLATFWRARDPGAGQKTQ